MKLVFFTQEDPFYVKVFFDEFFEIYPNLSDINAIVISRAMGQKSTYKLVKQMLNFYGFVNFTKMGVKYSFAKMMGQRNIIRNVKNEFKKTYTIRQLCSSYDLKVMERSDLNSMEFLRSIDIFEADLFISVASPIIWKEKLIRQPKLDCINIHNSSLPNYRGMMPNFWQLYHDEEYSGITIHRIDVGIDTGDIIDEMSVPIEEYDSLNALIRKTKKLGAKMMVETIEKFRNGSIDYKKVDINAGSYYSFPTQKDVKKFKAKGKKLF